ncbi:MAG: phosphonoacetaldehyde reductase [Succinatimonas sp.]|nr:phosphonoacetaldehyde reductase [Succinatimonas sp.]
MNNYYNPVHCIEGFNCIDELLGLIKGTNAQNILTLVWSDSVLQLDIFNQILREKGVNLKALTLTFSNPTIDDLFDTYLKTKNFNADLIIGVGGGSILDVTKSLCTLKGLEIKNVDELRDIIINKSFANSKTPWIGIPTTAGTGSEVTCWATIWDPNQEAKRSVESKDNYAKFALVDPSLTKNIPVSLGVSSALDALAHAIEAYWAKATNVVSRAHAIAAIKIIKNNLNDLLDGKNTAHEAMAKGSMLAGLAFSNTKTTACHSISYPLTMHYNIPHGVAVSMLLGEVFKLNFNYIDDSKNLLDALGVNSPDELKEFIKDIMTKANIKNKLSLWGAKETDIEKLVPLCITKGRADNNPCELTNENLKEILKAIF